MSEHRPGWPEYGELVVATIESIRDYGAYANIDEYKRRGFLHISEISSARIRNVRDFIRENQKMVLKVVRVDVEKGHIDLSLRRVTKRERIEKSKAYKKNRKAETLLHEVAQRLNLPMDEVYEKVGAVLEEKYGLYDGFETALKEGSEALAKLGIPEDLSKIVVQVAKERIRIRMVKVKGVLEVRCLKPNGVRCIQKAFIDARESQKAEDVKIEFCVIAAPRYGLEVSADSWKRAEEILEKVSENVIENIAKAGGIGAFNRTK